MPEVALERVTYTLPILRDVMRDGYVQYFGRQPSDGELGYGWAVARLETGGKTWNNNFGNVKCFPQCQETSDWVDLTETLLKAGKTPCPLDPSLPQPDKCEYPGQRAYPTGGGGAKHWWSVLDRKRYDGVLELATEGRAYDACYLMGESGYYQADKNWYSKQVEAMYKQYIDLYGGPLPDKPPGPVEPVPASPGISARNWAIMLAGTLVGYFGYRAIRGS